MYVTNISIIDKNKVYTRVYICPANRTKDNLAAGTLPPYLD